MLASKWSMVSDVLARIFANYLSVSSRYMVDRRSGPVGFSVILEVAEIDPVDRSTIA